MTIDITYPIGWSDINKKHLDIIAQASCLNLQREEFLFYCFSRFTGLRIKRKKQLEWPSAVSKYKIAGKTITLDPGIIRGACESIDYVLDQVELLSFTPDVFKKISPMLYDVKFEQYYYCDVFINQYQQTNKKVFIKKAIKALSGKRRYFISHKECKVILIWWNGVRKFMMDRYPYVFAGSGEGGNGGTPADAYLSILSCLNNNSPQANNDIAKSEVHSVFLSLNIKLESYAKHRSA